MIERRFGKVSLRYGSNMDPRSCGVVSGTAATYGRKSSDLGGFKEKIHPQAFTRALQSGKDVYCLANHDPSLVLGRLKNKTLQLSSDSKGLQMRCMLPDTSVGRDIRALVERGDMGEMSFAFNVPDGGDSWDEEDDCDCGDPGCTNPDCERSRVKVRTLRNVNLHDVSIVTMPAYPGTSVHVSSMDPAAMGRSIFPEGIPVEVRAHVPNIGQVQARRRSTTNLILSL